MDRFDGKMEGVLMRGNEKSRGEECLGEEGAVMGIRGRGMRGLR